MEATTTIKTFVSKVKEAAGVSVNYRVTSDGSGVNDIFASIKRDSDSLGHVTYVRSSNRGQMFFDPFDATTAKEKKAITAVVMADLEELLTPESNG